MILRMPKLIFYILLLVIWCFPVPQSLSAQPKITIEIDHSGNDSTGQRLAYQIKERIRKSAGLRLSNLKEADFAVFISSLSIPNQPASAISITVTINIGNLYSLLGSGVQICGDYAIDRTADAIVAKIDSFADELRKHQGPKR